MNKLQATARLQAQRTQIDGLFNADIDDRNFKKWHRDTSVAIRAVFGDGSGHGGEFEDVSFYSPVAYSDMPPEMEVQAFQRGLRTADALLESMIDEIAQRDDGFVAPANSDTLSTIENTCRKFQKVARQLRVRHASRSTLEINDEYDVQDLLHALLKLSFDDVRPEEWTPSYAGAASRVDFLLKTEEVVIEVKKTRAGLKDADIGAQLVIDTARYRSHPNCKTLVCFVFDPEGRVGNPEGLKRDLENQPGPLVVRVIIAP